MYTAALGISKIAPLSASENGLHEGINVHFFEEGDDSRSQLRIEETRHPKSKNGVEFVYWQGTSELYPYMTTRRWAPSRSPRTANRTILIHVQIRTDLEALVDVDIGVVSQWNGGDADAFCGIPDADGVVDGSGSEQVGSLETASL